MLTRRAFLARSAVAGVGAYASASAAGEPPVEVQVAEGTLRGSVSHGVQVFRGVPFAQPPVGPLRFRPPQPPLAFPGVRLATQFAAASVQPDQASTPQSEDCLYLNVWAPQRAASRVDTYPVFVWIHGGGFTGGRSFDPLSDGSRFADAGIVCVTVAYRLGALGFLDVSPLLGAEYAGSADNAMRDVVAALQWVRSNIHAFGGDPGRVTIGGESAGAKLTDLLMGVPSAAPLFHQMISESGGAERIWPAARGMEVGQGFGRSWQEQTSTAPATLRNAPVQQIVEVQDRFQKDWPVHFPFRPELAPDFIPRPPLEAIQAGSTRGKRLLLGTNRDESALFLGPHPQSDPGAKDLGNLPLKQFDAIAARYAQLYPNMPADLRRVRSVTAEEYWIPSLRVADAHLAGGGESFVYRLDFPGSGRFAGLAYHSYDLRFVWDYFGEGAPSQPALVLAQQMHGAWISFIQGRAPSAPSLPVWPRYTLPGRPTMLFDQPSRVAEAPGAAEFALWDGTLSP